MITGRTAPEDQEKALEAGVDDYLVKPFSVRLLNVRLAVAEERVRDRVARRLADTQRQDVEDTFQELFASFPDIVFRIDTEGRFTYVNEAVRGIGYAPGDLQGQHFSSILHPEDAAAVSRADVLPRHAGVRTGDQDAPKLFDERRTGERATTELEVRLRSRDGTEEKQGVWDRIGEVTACGIYDSTTDEPERRFVGSLGIIRDVTRRRRAEAALIRSERLAAVGTLASGVAHEFNNLNVGILGYADVLRQDEALPSKQRQRADVIFRAASAARSITEKLLSFARGRQAERRVHDLNAVVRNTVDLMGLTLEKESVDLRFEPGEVRPAVFDEGEISQVLLNFLVNARDALHGRPERTVTVRTGREGDRVYVAVADTGCGIPADQLAQIFTPFHTTKAGPNANGQQQGRGTGLGLSVCDGIVRHHGGEIAVHSEVGRGSVFTLWLPAGTPAAALDADAAALTGTRVLVLAAGEHAAALFREAVEEAGGACAAVNDLPDAAEHLRAAPVDVLVVDLERAGAEPGRAGLTSLLAEVAEAGRPVPAVVGLLGPDAEPGGPAPLLAALLVKPFTRQRILEAVQEALTGG